MSLFTKKQKIDKYMDTKANCLDPTLTIGMAKEELIQT